MPQMHLFHLLMVLVSPHNRKSDQPSPEIEHFEHSTRQSAAPLVRLGLEVIKGYKRDEGAKDVVAQPGICQSKPHVMGTSFA